MITQLQIEYFLAINETKNISQAAKKLIITPQTLSHSLESIERELGTTLFERGIPLTLTDSGQIFLEYAQNMVEMRNNMLNAINDITGNVHGTIRIGISYNRSPVLLPGTITEFQKHYPTIDFFVFEGNQSEIKQALLARKIDLAVEHIPYHDPNILEEEILKDYLYLLIPKGMLEQRFGSRASLILKELEQEKSIYSLADLPFLLNKKGNSIRAIMESIFEQEQISPPIGTETENMETLFNMCVIGRGVTVYPGSFLHQEKLAAHTDALHIVKIPNEKAQYTLGVAYRKKHQMTKASKYFIEVLRKHAQMTMYSGD